MLFVKNQKLQKINYFKKNQHNKNNKNKMDVNKILEVMLEYQRINNIEKQCTTNTTIMYDILRCCGMKDVKVRPVIVIGTRNKILTIVKGHIVIDIGNDEFIECSYDVSIIEDAQYVDNIKDLIFILPNIPPDFKKEIIKSALDFQKIANDINNGEFFINSREVYHGQLNYIEKKCNIKCVNPNLN
jgi:hypothetical protein